GQRVYNPWAILNCFSDREFGSYWWSSGTPGMLLTMAEKLGRPDQDLEGIQVAEMALLFDIAQPELVPLLWQSGYLTLKVVANRVCTLGFPNAEVREAWFGMMLGYFCGGKTTAGQTAAALMLDALIRRVPEDFQRALTALFAAIPGELHGGREAFYHAVFVAALQAVGGEILAESRTDKGRSDAVIKTRETIYIVEFKLGTAEAALAQIRARRYFEPYLTDPRPVILLAAGGFAERNIRCLWEDLKK
ncbi:MAG: PD-(D/E)XK nuclease domain-containing protein, partial [Verrucomicrobiae bacterium]